MYSNGFVVATSLAVTIRMFLQCCVISRVKILHYDVPQRLVGYPRGRYRTSLLSHDATSTPDPFDLESVPVLRGLSALCVKCASSPCVNCPVFRDCCCDAGLCTRMTEINLSLR